MRLGRMAAAHPLSAAMIFQGLFIPIALGLALLLGVTPWQDFEFSVMAVAFSVSATAPLLLALGMSAYAGSGWFRELDALVRPTLIALFRNRPHAAVVLVSLLAGFGEELLFRGVLQAWLAELTGPWPGVLLASLLFGLLHFLSWTYFFLATALGVYLGALYELTGNLLIVCLVHALYDWVAITWLLRRGDT